MDQQGGRLARPWGTIASIASLGAAAIHFAAVGEHLSEYRPAGAFMLASGLLQLISGSTIARNANARMRDGVLAMNAGIVGLWLWSRAIGLPFGPDAGMREHIHATDALATGLEILIVLALFADARGMGVRHAWARALVVCTTLASLHATAAHAHDASMERLVAAAGLLLGIVLSVFVATVPFRIPGRDHVQITRARRITASPRLVAGARSGAR